MLSGGDLFSAYRNINISVLFLVLIEFTKVCTLCADLQFLFQCGSK